MNKFYRIQKISSIIPYWSTLVVAIITMVELKRHSASKKIWASFISVLFTTGAVAYLVNTVIMTGKNPILNVIVSGIILAVANVLMVKLQVMSIPIQQEETKPKKSNAKRYWIVLGIVAVVLGLGALLSLLFSPSVDIEDTNGSYDTNLNTISQNDILSTSNNYAAFSSATSFSGPETNIIGSMEEYDHQECAFSCNQISGIMTLQATKTKNCQLTLDISSQLDEGNMEIVVIVDGAYYCSIPANQNKSVILSDIADKTVVVRIAAESAKVKVTVKRTVS